MIIIYRSSRIRVGFIVLALMLLSAVVYGDDRVHTVRKGETIYSIARRYQLGVNEVAEKNRIVSPFKISIGQQLIISPEVSLQVAATPSESTYRIQAGDTYYSIARKNGVELDNLLRLNGRTPADVLRIGEVLRLPAIQVRRVAQVRASNPVPPATVPNVQIASASGLFWPHSGTRTAMTGKFPGIMIRGNRGDNVVSISTGRVIYAGPHTSFGRVVLVQSNEGHIYVYGGQENVAVRVGDIITPGAPIGRLGESRLETTPSLYFSVWRNNDFVDPVAAPRG